ncbi:lipase family protein [Streptomyces cavernicola]|uniref:Lipase family protein n=1 Tax=Streptomyces cavernicola TaxID=3043613 RepID=A0ABT6SNE1_9ACTN|nr:lipase family protein [Streptomyces sp. B-S-A6]MDI3409444.1 lipase family protein [Streptomyces sp. B-S-A6]
MDGRPLTERLQRAPWNAIVADQQLGKRKPTAPVLLSRSALDDVVPQQVGKNLVADWCRQGARVRFAGRTAPSTCCSRTSIWGEPSAGTGSHDAPNPSGHTGY